jgi:hypothetical protein
LIFCQLIEEDRWLSFVAKGSWRRLALVGKLGRKRRKVGIVSCHQILLCFVLISITPYEDILSYELASFALTP